MNSRFLKFLFVPGVFGLTACVSSRHATMPKTWLASATRKIQRVCELNSRSGFSADIVLNNAASARVEAVWNNAGRLSGQLINTLGEDFLSFQIDEFGQFKTTQAIDDSESMFQALELLAQIGPLQTRYLLCSGLFVSSSDNDTVPPTELSSVLERKLITSQATFHLLSSISPSASNNAHVNVKSHVSTNGFIFRKSVAEVAWQGRIEQDRIHPNRLTISSDTASIRLLFHDFD